MFGADRLTALVLGPVPTAPLLPPQTAVRYQTAEFDITARVNRLGFRGNETSVHTGQIVAIGDSFTFGWGVKADDTWQRVLARKLKEAGKATEVYNLGRPGADPRGYLVTAKTYIPLLKPRFVIVGLLQGEDVAQLVMHPTPTEATAGVVRRAKDVLPTLFPNLVGLARSMRARVASEQVLLATANWERWATRIMAERSIELEDDLRAMALNGSLNPGLLQWSASYPDFATDAYSPRSQAAAGRQRAAAILQEIAKLASEHGGQVVLLSMPLGVYSDSVTRQNRIRMGFNLPDSLLSSSEPEAFTATVCAKAGILCVDYSSQFRHEVDGVQLWFAVDGHLTPRGNRLLGEALSNDLMPLL